MTRLMGTTPEWIDGVKDVTNAAYSYEIVRQIVCKE
jgi:hypothetical protein